MSPLMSMILRNRLISVTQTESGVVTNVETYSTTGKATELEKPPTVWLQNTLWIV